MAKPMRVKACSYRGFALIHHVNRCVGFVNLGSQVKEHTIAVTVSVYQINLME